MRENPDEYLKETVEEWLAATTGGNGRLELHMSVLKMTKKDVFGRKGKQQPCVLCLVTSEAKTGTTCDVIILKLSGAGRLEEDSKRRCNVAGIQAVTLVSPESPKEKKSKKDTAEEYTEAVLITSQSRADGYLCLNKSERLHLLLALSNFFRSMTGKDLTASGLDEHDLAAVAAAGGAAPGSL